MRVLCSHQCSHVTQGETRARRGHMTSWSWGLNPILPLCLGSICSSASKESPSLWPSSGAGQKPSPHIICSEGAQQRGKPGARQCGRGCPQQHGILGGEVPVLAPILLRRPWGCRVGLGASLCMCSFIHEPSTGSSSLSHIWPGCVDWLVERAQVLGTNVGSSSSQLGDPKQITALL